jgi:hypothetical protein
MNSKLLLALFLSASVTLNAQKQSAENVRTLSLSKSINHQIKPASVNSSYSSRADIWTDGFSTPSDWTSTSLGAPNDRWEIGTNGPDGPIPIPDITSTSGGNFALFDSDSSCSGNQIVNLTYNNAIDCAAFPDVLMQFEQMYQRFNDSTFVFVSNDGGTNWTKYPVNAGYTTNDISTNPELVKINISATAGGQSDVRIRFQFWSPSTYVGPGTGGSGCGYAWMIDDVKLATPPDYELITTTVYHASPVTDFVYGTYPLSQADTVTVFAIVTNEGALAQEATLNYNVLRGATSVNTGSSSTFTLEPFTTDTIVINTGYIPDVAGSYTLSCEITSANTDANPANNTSTSMFNVTNYIYSGVRSLTGIGAYSFSGATPGPYDPSKIGQIYQIINAASIKAIDIAVSSITTANTDLIIELFDAGDLSVPLTIGDFSVTSSHPTTAQYFTIELPEEQNLVAGGFYLASMGSEATDKRFVFYATDVDEDDATRLNVPDDSGVLTWFRTDLTPAINLNFDPSVGIANVDGTDKLSVYPNPANESLAISFDLNVSSSVAVNLIDLSGKVVFSKTISGKILKYQDTISLSDYANGIYTLQVSTKNGMSTEKVVIAH